MKKVKINSTLQLEKIETTKLGTQLVHLILKINETTYNLVTAGFKINLVGNHSLNDLDVLITFLGANEDRNEAKIRRFSREMREANHKLKEVVNLTILGDKAKSKIK